MTRQRTRWLYTYKFANAVLRAGQVHNPNPKHTPPDDIVRFQLLKTETKKGELHADWCLRLDEAVLQAAALNHVAAYILQRRKREADKQHD